MSKASHVYQIRLAEPRDVPHLAGIEREAASRFVEVGYPELAQGPTLASAVLAEAQQAQQLWVAATAQGEPVGFALAMVLGEQAYVKEMSVLPSHGRQGLGRRLVEGVCEWARAHGFCSVTLTTFREVAWNAPFYRRLGFQEVPEAMWTEAIRAVVREEQEAGLDPAHRVVMVCTLETM